MLLRKLAPREVRICPNDVDGARDFRGQRDAAPPSPREDHALAEGVARVADAALGIDDVARAQAVARRAGAVRPVEGKHAGLDRGERDAAIDAGEALAHPERLVVPRLDEEPPFAELERELDALGEPPLEAVLQDEAIDDHVEVVNARAIELDLVSQIHHRAVDAGADEALAPEAFELQFQFALSRAGHRRKHAEARSFRHREEAVDDLLDRLRFDSLAAMGTMRNADARIEKTQVVGDFGHRADGGSRRLRERPLLDRDGGTQPLDSLDVGLRQLLQELARVRAERLDIAPLALGVDRIECERRFPRTARAREDDDFATGQTDAYIFQVVLAGANYDETVQGGTKSLARAAPVRLHGRRPRSSL